MAFKCNKLKFKAQKASCPLASIPGASFPAFTAKGVEWSLKGVCVMGAQVGPQGLV